MASNSSEENATFDPCFAIEARDANHETTNFISTIHDANTPNERSVLELPGGTYEFYLSVTGFKVNPQSELSDLETSSKPLDWKVVSGGQTDEIYPSLAIKLKKSNSLDWTAERKHRVITGSLIKLGRHSIEKGMHKFFVKGVVGLVTTRPGAPLPHINTKVYNVEQVFDLEIIEPQESSSASKRKR